MENNDKSLNGIVLNGRFYRALPGQLKDIFNEDVNGVLRYTKVETIIDARTDKHTEFVHNYRFRFSQSITDKINGK